MPDFKKLPPLSLYVHLPWCEKKCPYCDFNSHVRRRAIPEVDYVRALLTDLESGLGAIRHRRLHSIYLGGGTPSLFQAKTIAALLTGIRSRVATTSDVEVTLEANPGSADTVKFAGFCEAGVNRLSIGVQSFDPDKLARLGRIHGRQEALAAAQAAREAGFANFNLDLMFGLPSQSLSGALSDMQIAIDQGPSHISCYQLTVEPNTAFYHRPPQLPDHDLLGEMQAALDARLADAGYARYEVSAYAPAAAQCRHNRNYWEYGDYLGIGAGAHSKITVPGRVLRWQRPDQPERYLHGAADDPLGLAHEVRGADLDWEFMLNALRLKAGVPARAFFERTGRSLRHLDPILSKLKRSGLLCVDPETLKTTDLGYRFLDDVVQRFLPTPGVAAPLVCGDQPDILNRC
ncbi:MAG: radical SAM family heme chaperone HemW [Gammaproteobacteria bacterium]|nr:radical SAM family heme chaperone HemW [Gammaproteobacteria bacterium]